jgi:predicted amidophosphoribosyltransferase
MITFHPKRLAGNWFEGYALDYHTLSSTFLGYNAFGHKEFDNVYSEIGKLLYKLKSKSDRSVLNDIIEATIYFIKQEWGVSDLLDAIIPMLPSNVKRKIQPVIEITRELSDRLQIPLYENALRKIHHTPELKDIFDYKKRLELLQNNFYIDDEALKEKKILLFDDLFRSGATLSAVTSTLYEKGKVARVYALTLTKTRSLR